MLVLTDGGSRPLLRTGDNLEAAAVEQQEGLFGRWVHCDVSYIASVSKHLRVAAIHVLK